MDAFLEYYKDNNGTSSKHTLTAMRGNLNRISKILDKNVEELNASDFKNVDSIVEEIIDTYSISTSISKSPSPLLSNSLSLLITFLFPGASTTYWSKSSLLFSCLSVGPRILPKKSFITPGKFCTFSAIRSP